MVSYRKIKYFIWLVFLSFSLNAQNSFSDYFFERQQAILDLDAQLSDSINKNYTEQNSEVIYLDAYAAFVFGWASNKKTEIIKADKLLSKNIVRLASADDAKSQYFLANAHLMLCLISFQEQEVLKTLSHYWMFQKLRKRNERNFPNFSMNRKHAIIGEAISHWADEMVFGKNNEYQIFWQSEYLKLVDACKAEISYNPVALREIILIDGIIQGYLSDQFLNNSIEINYYSGPLETFVCSLNSKKKKDYSQNLQLLANADSMGYLKKLPILNLWFGIALLNKLDFDAEQYLLKYIDDQEYERYSGYARLKLSWLYIIRKQSSRANQLIQQIENEKNTFSAEDKQALYEIKHARYWTPELIQSRLLFDGGNYVSSIDVLLKNKVQVSSYQKAQKIEYSYRLARSYQMVKNYDKAIIFYQIVIQANLESEYYYGSYAAYYLAEIYEVMHENDKARNMYQECLKMDSPVYKSEIHSKANQALKSLESK